ncbi:drug resistance transporter, Bcr/CflA family protein [Candidatus Moduliflexus flocculans]|uniref:Drug resistance transporter, Bcr/CflA family protein n=1 Tax=Candidatus Moduliflexus flocculans TaxID=1499966 RepID=A0A0S6W0Z5_9BACT|nr:drug resistance transporter, Bcr/CflA family protein [Candidatus Moduliflexus flocculans]
MNKTLVTESPTQRYLGTKMLIAFITMMNMFIPLSMGLYLPALPTMGSQLNCSPVMINLTF